MKRNEWFYESFFSDIDQFWRIIKGFLEGFMFESSFEVGYNQEKVERKSILDRRKVCERVLSQKGYKVFKEFKLIFMVRISRFRGEVSIRLSW